MRPISVRTKYNKTASMSNITLNGVTLGWGCRSALKQLGLRKTARYIMRLNEVGSYAAIRRAGAKRREIKLVIVLQSAYEHSASCRIAGFGMSIPAARSVFRGGNSAYLLHRLEGQGISNRTTIPFIARLRQVR